MLRRKDGCLIILFLSLFFSFSPGFSSEETARETQEEIFPNGGFEEELSGWIKSEKGDGKVEALSGPGVENSKAVGFTATPEKTSGWEKIAKRFNVPADEVDFRLDFIVAEAKQGLLLDKVHLVRLGQAQGTAGKGYPVIIKARTEDYKIEFTMASKRKSGLFVATLLSIREKVIALLSGMSRVNTSHISSFSRVLPGKSKSGTMNSWFLLFRTSPIPGRRLSGRLP